MGIRRKYKGEEIVEAPQPEQEPPAEVRWRKPKECGECGHPKKQTRRFEMTPARKAAWEKCVKAREESLNNQDRDKEIKKLEKAQKALEEKRRVLGLTVEPEVEESKSAGEQPQSVSGEPSQSLAAPKPRKPKRVVLVESESESESDEECEFIIEKVRREKKNLNRAVKPKLWNPSAPQHRLRCISHSWRILISFFSINGSN